jgi:hypothetical protein
MAFEEGQSARWFETHAGQRRALTGALLTMREWKDVSILHS